ncbi:MAG: WD40/YVTN/BNR-like repeat-containing protein [Acidimicrobiales bacterium]
MIRLATAEGVVDLTDDDRIVQLRGQGVRALSNRWAVLDREAVTTLDGTINVTFPELRPWCVAALPGDDSALVGTAEAHVFRVAADGGAEPVDSFDAIPTRDEWYTPWGGPPDVRSLAVGPGRDVFVNVHVGGIWLGPAGADKWEAIVEVDADVHQVTVAGDGRTVVAAAAIGCGVSTDGGRTWQWSDDGLHASYCRAAAVAGDMVLVTASTGPSTRSGAVYRRPVGSDGPFEPCTNGIPETFPYNLDTHSLAAVGADVALGTRDGRLFVSADAGGSWDLVADDLPEIRSVELV